ncbi:MAG TPA: ABC transporter ATP-binding protein [Thermodesulfobacteriota bacterium]
MDGVRIEIEDLGVRYRDVQAVRGVSLVVEPSEFVALLGPSGCGKTSLLRAIAGFVDYDGEIRIGGRVVDGVPAHRRGVGMVFQDYALFPHRTVRENIGYGLAMRRTPRAEAVARVDEMVRLLKLQGLEGRYPGQLSGGQQQRVALARAIAVNPAVLLLDEPLGALDRKLREEMQVELRQLQKRVGITAVFVTHDQEEALALADRIAVMNGGRIEQVAGPVELYERPVNRFVADFIGRSNLLAATVVEADGRRAVCRVGEADRIVLVADGAWTPLAPGRTLTLAARPEKLALALPQEAPAGRNALHGVIEHVTYLGMITEVRVRLATGDILDVVEQNSTADGRRAARHVGDRVAVHWNPADTVVVD